MVKAILQYLLGYLFSNWNLIKVWSPTILLPPSFERALLLASVTSNLNSACENNKSDQNLIKFDFKLKKPKKFCSKR